MLCICAAIAIISTFFAAPGANYMEYIDFRVICLLFCLMAVVVGMQECGLFKVLAYNLLSGKKQFSILSLILILLPFFTSMLVTNDVALIAFVPFTIIVMDMIEKRSALIRIVVLQTMAANLGSMATPMGNPHDLFLYEYYGLSAGEYFQTIFPLVLASLIGISSAAAICKNDTIQVYFESREQIREPKKLAMYTGLFVLCVLSVFRLLDYLLVTAVVLVCMMIFSRGLLKKVDYPLLLTFVCFFIFAGNMGNIPEVRWFLSKMLHRSTLFSAMLSSQVISNVPSSVLLSGFTDNWEDLLLGVNIGGLGTPIASLASLISLRIYMKSEGARPLRYLCVFTAANIVGIAYLLLIKKFLY